MTALDPAVERAILRCLDPDPASRPASALSVSAALPGGDPLAAALAAGETPSPEMVAAAGQGAGVGPRLAWAVLVAAAAGLAASFALGMRTSRIDTLGPPHPPAVLAQKARDALAAIGYTEPARDDAYGFDWDELLARELRARAAPGGPSPWFFWYRQSREPLMAITFHTDLLTPGVVDIEDPPPTTSGMIAVTLDHTGRLRSFEAIPPQRLDGPLSPAAVDWTPLFALAGLDAAQLQTADPVWTFLAASDTRAAWTGRWPETDRSLRVEAAALGGRPTAFLLVDPTATPSRMPEPANDAIDLGAIVLMMLAVSILAGASLLALRHLRAARGDRQGAARLAAAVTAIMLAMWACKVHLVASPVFIAIFLLAVCTCVFYGVLHWTLYLALEPIVRRHWPQVLVSAANVLSGRVRDPVVGRDVLFGVALGVAWTVLLRLIDAAAIGDVSAEFPGAPELLLGLRSTLGLVLEEAPYAIRNAFLYFFLLFVLRVLLRSQWLAALAFGLLFGGVSALTDESYAEAVITFLYFGSGAIAILRLGLLTTVTGSFVMALLMDVLATSDTSAWYFGNMMLLVALVAALAGWAAHTATAGRLVKVSAFG